MRIALLALTLSLSLLSQGAYAAEFGPLRFDDDFGEQRTICANGRGIECWKARPIGNNLQLSVGGELRWRYDHTRYPGYGADPQDKWGALLQRYSVFADVRAGSHFRGFVQLGTSLSNGRAGGPSPVDENRLDPSNLFVEWSRASEAAGRIGLRTGIQELRLGSARLIDVRDGTNVRRSFDAVRGYMERGSWRVDAFAAAPRQHRPGSFDDARSRTQAIRGVYATHSASGTGWDAYLLHYEDAAAHYAQGTARERRWTLGARSFGSRGQLDWNHEAALQVGRFGNARIRAWTLATETGYRFDTTVWQPRLALLAAVASGDGDAGDTRLATFNPMYPRGNYFGEEASLGPRNFFNIHPTLSLTPTRDIELSGSLDVFWRHRLEDAVYAPSGGLVRAPGDSSARHVATIASMGADWSHAPGWQSSVVLAHVWPGRFLEETGPHERLHYVEITLRHQF
ncbi:MAG: alginate export family protein [Luteimonas sp.]